MPQLHWSLLFLILFVAMLTRYFGFAGIMYLICKKTKKQPLASTHSPETQITRDIAWSVISTVIFALVGVWLIIQWQKGNTRIYFDVSQYGVLYLIVSLPLLLFLYDTYFYWSHRLLHHKKLFSRFHKAHHQSRIPTAWTSFAFHPVEAMVQALILPILLMTIPVHMGVLVAFLLTMTFFGVFNHLGYEFLPRYLEAKLGIITATHHHIHHQKVTQNYGLFFNFWDIAMKTEHPQS